MPTIDLSTPPPAAPTLLEALPRRVTLTLRELQRVAAAAGGAPLPFDLSDADGGAGGRTDGGADAGAPEVGGLADRLGGGLDAGADPSHTAYAAALATLHDADQSLARRGLLVGEQVDDGLVGAVGLLATPEVALDLDVAVGALRARAWHRQAGDAVATLATVDGLVFELAWFGVAQWPLELGRVAVLPEDLSVGDSGVPARLDVPYELLDAAGEAVRSDRADLLPVLVAQRSGALLDEQGDALDEIAATGALGALVGETRGRLRALVADVSGAETTVAGVVSWVLLDDGWHALRPHTLAGAHRVEVVRVEPAGLAADLAPVLAQVS